MKKRTQWAIAAIAATLVATLVVLNLMPAERQIDQRVERLYSADSEEFRREMGTLLGPPLVAGNRVDALQNGDEIFPAMLAAIRAAKKTITFETYIYWSGEIGQAFADALSERARNGVRVHVLLDWVGSAKIDNRHIDEMKHGGVESMHLMYLLTVTAATRSIDLATPYFVPDDVTVSTMIDALNRGVRVRIIVQGPVTDTEWVRYASRANWGALLAAGAQFFEYQPTLYHCKVLVVDGLMVSVGSTNFDNRSFRLNDEANLNVYDGAFARAQVDVFERDLAQSQRVSYEAWRATPWWQRVYGRTAALLDSQL